jgi:hypothetical protein
MFGKISGKMFGEMSGKMFGTMFGKMVGKMLGEMFGKNFGKMVQNISPFPLLQINDIARNGKHVEFIFQYPQLLNLLQFFEYLIQNGF